MGAWLGEASGYVDTGDGAPMRLIHRCCRTSYGGLSSLMLRVHVHVENHFFIFLRIAMPILVYM
jgi:hypothetical protein